MVDYEPLDIESITKRLTSSDSCEIVALDIGVLTNICNYDTEHFLINGVKYLPVSGETSYKLYLCDTNFNVLKEVITDTDPIRAEFFTVDDEKSIYISNRETVLKFNAKFVESDRIYKDGAKFEPLDICYYNGCVYVCNTFSLTILSQQLKIMKIFYLEFRPQRIKIIENTACLSDSDTLCFIELEHFNIISKYETSHCKGWISAVDKLFLHSADFTITCYNKNGDKLDQINIEPICSSDVARISVMARNSSTQI